MDAVPDNRPNAISAHFAGRVSDDPALVVEQHPKSAIRQNFVNNTFDREQFFFRHKPIVSFAEMTLSGQLVASGR